MEQGNILEARNITKVYPGGVVANHNVNLSVKKGEIHALVGENGAGKSTLMKMLFGMLAPTEGQIFVDGKEVHFTSSGDAIAAGLGMVHQHFMQVPSMTVAENLILGAETGSPFKVDRKKAVEITRELSERYNLKVEAEEKVEDISLAMRQKLEILKALYRGAHILILDEPTAVLTPQETEELFEQLLLLKESGHTIIFISHKLNEVSYVADKITVVRDGSTIETLTKGVDDFSEDRIIKGMVGREISDRFPKRHNVKIGDVNMEVKNWTVYHPLYTERKVVDNVSIKVRKGEVVGISGLMGAGRTELAMSIFGKSYGSNISGTLLLNGKEVHLHNVRDAIDHKLAYVTEDRKGDGLILSNTIKMNTSLANLQGISKNTIINQDKEYAVAVEYKEKLKTKCPSVDQNVGNLSGGNQQKVLLAKWMFADPDVLILDEPTRGIDVGAKYEIYCIINDLVAAGKSVIMISSELPEILGMSDRIYVMNEGRIAGELSREEATQESIMTCIMKSAKENK